MTKEEEQLLRKLLWIRHGCSPYALYGDDGEMQCNNCGIDFLRMSANQIEQRFHEINQPEVTKFFKSWRNKNDQKR